MKKREKKGENVNVYKRAGERRNTAEKRPGGRRASMPSLKDRHPEDYGVFCAPVKAEY